ncbi:MBOAT family O-acyltransferase [Gelidibacter japonicus]|uniref:MBOAT family O-acyltransferase n=1 Tax=Gelidibacter japonicus TaxID=1962232 RepID=UPI003A8E7C3D
MLFNSIDFAIFLPIVFLLYWVIGRKNIRAQNILIVAASYVFYGWWDWRFLFLILLSTVVDYTIGLALEKQNKNQHRKILLWTSLLVNLGLLGFFKYFNFFIDNFTSAFSFFGHSIGGYSLNIILPVGISFYTFQTLSYTIDVYNKKLKPTSDFISFSAFVSFFPQLVAGPIERATNLLPQFFKERNFNYEMAKDGLRQILWGLFKKIVIADNCAKYVNIIFENHEAYSGSTLVLGAVFFAFQIYCDFSGYSDIAIGTARLFGFNLMQNFAFPYFSRDMAEFWRRWHISLSTWFRDYVYIPLGGSKVSKLKVIRNVFIIFLVSGFWHGANWTFIFWGGLNALYFLPLLLLGRNRKNIKIADNDSYLPSFRTIFQIGITFSLTVFAWIFFRAENIGHAFSYIKRMLSMSLLSFPNIKPSYLLILLFAFILIEWVGRKQQYALENLWRDKPIYLRWGFYYLLIVCMYVYGIKEQEFIYFQF